MRKLPVVHVGQIWEDCDKRMHGRRRQVIGFDREKAIMADVHGLYPTKVAIRRMYPHSTGWKLIKGSS